MFGVFVKHYLKNVVVLLCLLATSCSTYKFVGKDNFNRKPSAETNKALEEVFSFSAVEKAPKGKKAEIEKQARETLDVWVTQAHVSQAQKRVEFFESEILPEGKLFKLVLDMDESDSKLVFRIFHTADAFKDKTATVAMTDFVQTLMNQTVFGNIYSVFEAYYNAKHGDPIATDNLLTIRMSEPTLTFGDNLELLNSAEYKKVKANLGKVKESLAQEIKAVKAQRKANDAKRKVGLDALDKAPEAKQFRNLIAKGDREGAAALLKKYLPWEDMAPFEKKYWETYLAVIEKPVPLEQRVLVYRGIEDDYIHRGFVAGKELTEEEAVLQNKAFIMSSGMVKNQGTWNRRLRTLEAMNGKFIGTINGEDDFAQSARITTMFLNHSGNPQGSPFISFTPKIDIAEAFGFTKISAYLIDPRLLSFNYASSFENEVEFLVPLSTFPDDLVAIFHHKYNAVMGQLERQKSFDEKLRQILIKEYGKDKAPGIFNKIKKNTYQFFKLHYPGTADAPGKSPAADNKAFFKNFLDADDPQPNMTPQGDLTCKDLIKTFWMVK